MRFNVFRCKVCKNERIEVDKQMAKLLCTLRSHFDYCMGAPRSNRITQKFLYKEATRNGHFAEIARAFVTNFESDCSQ